MRNFMIRGAVVCALAFATASLGAAPQHTTVDAKTALTNHGPIIVLADFNGKDIMVAWDAAGDKLELYRDKTLATGVTTYDDAGGAPVLEVTFADTGLIVITTGVDTLDRPTITWSEPGFEPVRVSASKGSIKTMASCKCWPPTATGTVTRSCTFADCDNNEPCKQNAGGVATAHCEWRGATTQ